MSDAIDDGGPAFPGGVYPKGYALNGRDAEGLPMNEGLSLRDYFAGQAIAGLTVGCAGMLRDEFSAYAKGSCNAALSERAYCLADAMLAARKGPTE